MSVKVRQRVGVVLFVTGILLGLGVTGLSVWAHVEMLFFGFPRFTNNALALDCPRFLAWDETAEVRTRLVNTNAHPATMGVKSWVSVPLAWKMQAEHRRLEPGEVWEWSRAIGPENRELRHFVFVSVYTFGGYPIQEKQNMCGVYVLPVKGIRGDTVMWIVVIVAFLALVSGWWLWRSSYRGRRPSPMAKVAVNFFLVMVPLTVIVTLWVAWVPGVMLLLVATLMLVIVGLTWLMHV